MASGADVQAYDGASLASLLPEWRALRATTTGPSPWADPDLVVVWYQTYCDPGDVVVLAVRARDGLLLGVAPLWTRRIGRGRAVLTSLEPVGAVHEPFLYELPHLLLRPGDERRVMAAVVGWLGTQHDWDWAVLPLLQDQGWWESRWLTDAGVQHSAVLSRSTTPFVTLALPPSTSAAAFPSSRNLRESLRRSRNRLARSGHSHEIVVTSDGDSGWSAAVDDLVELHARRAAMTGSVRHPDIFAATRQRALLDGAAARGPGCGTRLEIRRLVVDGKPAAALLTAVDHKVLWLSVSGLDAAWWDVGPVTLLQHHAVAAARESGLTRAVFAAGVDTSKLRWSEDVRSVTDFVVVHRRVRSRAAFRIVWQVRAAVTWRVARTRADAARDQRSGLAGPAPSTGSTTRSTT